MAASDSGHVTGPPSGAAGLRAAMRALTRSVGRYVVERSPAPGGRALDRAAWGFAQPLLGLRVWVADPQLRRRGIVPVIGLLLVCAASASNAEGGTVRRLAAAQATLLALAPVPSVLFGRTYARLAARAHERLGFGPAAPHLKGLLRYAWEFVLQGLCVGIGVGPLVALAEAVPGVGALWGLALGGLWALHWIVVEGYDTGRVDPPDGPRPNPDADRPAWFARGYAHLGRPLGPLGILARGYGRLLDRLAREWRPEIALMERHPAEAVGFGLATALLLAVPGLNLLFRPAVVVGAVHLRAHLDRPAAPADGPQAAASNAAGTGGLGRNRTDA